MKGGKATKSSKREPPTINTAPYYVQIVTLTLANGHVIFKVSCKVTNFGTFCQINMAGIVFI